MSKTNPELLPVDCIVEVEVGAVEVWPAKMPVAGVTFDEEL